jgi:hypothetical protein
MAAHDDPRALLVALRESTNRSAFWKTLTAEQTAALNGALREEERQIEQEWRDYAAQSQTPRVEAAPTPTAKPKKKIKQSKEFADRRSRWRETDLKIIVRYSAEVLGKRTTLKALAVLFQNRDITNPEDVTGADVGNKLALTVERVFKFEELASAYAKAQNYAKPAFAFKTITACDKEAEELGRQRRTRRNQRVSERRREERAEQRSKAMAQSATATPTTAGLKTLADLVAEQKARTRAQCDALYAALDPDEFISVGALTDRVRSHSAWRTVSSVKIERDIRTRLDMMTDAGRIENSVAPGPRGSRLRLVRRAKIDRATAQPRE